MRRIAFALVFCLVISEPMNVLATEGVSVSGNLLDTGSSATSERPVLSQQVSTTVSGEDTLLPYDDDEIDLFEDEIPADDVKTEEEYFIVSDLDGSSVSVDTIHEIISLREENTKSFLHSDHSITVATYPQAVHYEKDGKWLPIDNTLLYFSGDKTGYMNAAGSFSVRLSEYADARDLLSISDEDGMISMSYDFKSADVVTDLDGDIAEVSETEEEFFEAKNATDTEVQRLSHARIHILENGKHETVGKEKNEEDVAFISGSDECADDDEVTTSSHDLYALPQIESRVCYEDILEDVDLYYTLLPEGVKEELLLKSKDVPSNYSFSLALSGFDPKPNNDGDIILSKDGCPCYIIPAPVVTDANGAVMDDAHYELTETEEGYHLAIILESSWLKDDDRAYPVNVDPTIKKYKKYQSLKTSGKFACVASDKTSVPGDGSMYVGTKKGIHYRTYLNPDLPGIPAGAVVTDASLYLNVGSGSGYIYLYPVSAKPGSSYENNERNNRSNANASPNASDWMPEWEEKTINWSNQPAEKGAGLPTEMPVDYGKDGTCEFDITAPVKERLSGLRTDFGFYLRAKEDGKTDKKKVSLRQDEKKPFLEVTYKDFTGTENYLSTHDQDLSDAGMGSINDYTGYLTFAHQDARSAGERLPFTISHVYHPVFGQRESNHLWQEGMNLYGNHFTLSTDERILVPADECDVTKYPYVYIDSDGTHHYFKKKKIKWYENGAKKENSGTDYYPTAADEDGLGLFIVPVSDTTLKTKYPIKLTDKSGSMVKYFDASGYLCMVSDSNQKENGANKSSKAANRITIERSTIKSYPASEEKDSLQKILSGFTNDTFTISDVEKKSEAYISQINTFLKESHVCGTDYYSAKNLQTVIADLEVLRDTTDKNKLKGRKETVQKNLEKVIKRMEDSKQDRFLEVPVSVADPAGETSILTYDENNRLLSITDPSAGGKAVSYAYDSKGNLTKITHEKKDGKYTWAEFSYDTFGNLIKVMSDTGKGISYSYEAVSSSGKERENESSDESITAMPVSMVTEFYKSGKKTKTGQNFSIRHENLNETVYVFSGKDGVLGKYVEKYQKKTGTYETTVNKAAKDDIENVYLFDDTGKTVSVFSRMRAGKEIIGGSAYEYTETSEDGTDDGQANKLKEQTQTGYQTRNYLRNGSFETGDGWENLKKDTTKKYTGKNSALLKGENTGSRQEVLQVIEVPKNGYYTASVYLHTEGMTGKNAKAGLRLYKNEKAVSGQVDISEDEDTDGDSLNDEDENGDETDEDSDDEESSGSDSDGDLDDPDDSNEDDAESETGSISEDSVLEINNGWTRISATVKAMKNDKIKVCLYFEGTEGKAWFDCAQFERGTVPGQFNMLENGSFEADASSSLPSNWTYKNDGGAIDGRIISKESETAEGQKLDTVEGKNAFLITAETGKNKKLTVSPSFDNASASYVFSAYVKANLTPTRKSRKCYFYVKDGDTVYKKVKVNTDIRNWQYISVPMKVRNWNGANITLSLESGYGTILIDHCMVTKNEVQTYSYSSGGKLLTSKVKEKSTTYSVDSRDRRITQVSASKEKTTYAYDDTTNDLIKEKKPLGNNVTDILSHAYDTYGNETVTEEYRYYKKNGGNGKKTMSILTETGYDENGRFVTLEKDERGNRTEYDRDPATGQINQKTDPLDHMTDYTYDAYDQLSGVSKEGTNVAFLYNANRNLSDIKIADKKTGKSLSYKFTYDVYQNLVSVSSGKRKYVTNAYLPNNGEISKKTYGNGQKVSYGYDKYDRITSESWGGNDKVTYEYDNHGETTRVKDYGTGLSETYDYDQAGRITTARVYDEKKKAEKNALQNTYDSAGRIKTFSARYDGTTYTTDYTYLKNNKASKVTLPDGGRVSYTYDSFERPTKKTYQSHAVKKTGMNVENKGSMTWETDITYVSGGAFTTEAGKTFDAKKTSTHLPETYTSKIGKTQIQKETLSYDELSRIETYESDSKGNGSHKMDYSYDSLGRLTEAKDIVTGDIWNYTYDGLGNITSAEKNGETEGTWVYDSKNPDLLIAYNEADKEQADGQKNSKKGKKKATVKANIKYDKAGNPIKYLGKALAWNHGRNLAKLSDQNNQVQYAYTKDGVRLSKNVYDKKNKKSEKTTYILNGSTILSQKTGDETLNFYYDADGKVIGIGYNKGDGPEKEYMLARNAFGDVESIYTAEGTHVGSYLYDPYGKIIEIRKAEGFTDTEDILTKNPFRYRGYYCDTETGWYYLNSRYYDPTIKRFINADDVSYLGAGEEVNSYNLFAYCNGDPVNGVDDTGKVTVSISYGYLASMFLCKSYNQSVSFDFEGNYIFQKSYTKPIDWNSANASPGCGFIPFAGFGPALTVTSMSSVDSLNGYSSLIGGGQGLNPVGVGVELVHIGRMNDLDDNIHGISVALPFWGGSVGADFHAVETYSEELARGRTSEFVNDFLGNLEAGCKPFHFEELRPYLW